MGATMCDTFSDAHNIVFSVANQLLERNLF